MRLEWLGSSSTYAPRLCSVGLGWKIRWPGNKQQQTRSENQRTHSPSGTKGAAPRRGWAAVIGRALACLPKADVHSPKQLEFCVYSSRLRTEFGRSSSPCTNPPLLRMLWSITQQCLHWAPRGRGLERHPTSTKTPAAIPSFRLGFWGFFPENRNVSPSINNVFWKVFFCFLLYLEQGSLRPTLRFYFNTGMRAASPGKKPLANLDQTVPNLGPLSGHKKQLL